MTRVEQTPAEVRLAAVLAEFFADNEFQVVPREKEDKPDFLFTLKDQLIACEATQIPPAEIIQHWHKKGQQALVDKAIGVEVIWADEPHLWVAKAIRRKRNKIVTYKR